MCAGSPIAGASSNSPSPPDHEFETNRFNKNAFARPAAGTFVVQPRNGLRNPPFWTTDFGLRKTIPLQGQHRLQLRLEAFNVLNHPNWGGADKQSDQRFVRPDYQQDRRAPRTARREVRVLMRGPVDVITAST